METQPRHLSRSGLLIVASLAICAPIAAGQTYWQHDPATPGDWFVDANWTGGVPTSSVQAYVDNGGRAVADGAAEAQILRIEQADSAVEVVGGGVTVSAWTYVLDGAQLEHVAGNSDLGFEILVRDGSSVDVQGGSIRADRLECWGDTAVAQCAQSGGTVTLEEALALGQGPDAAGTYDLSGTGSLVTGEVVVGPDDSNGYFRQAGGTHTAGALKVQGVLSGHDAGYELLAGTLSAELIEVSGGSTFAQSGGDCSAGRLWVREPLSSEPMNTYEYTGGSLQADWLDLRSQLDLGGAAVTVLGQPGSWLDFSEGTITGASNAALNTAANSVVVLRDDQGPNGVFGSSDVQGILHRPGQTLVIPVGATIYGPDRFDDPVECTGQFLHREGVRMFLENGLLLHDGASVDLGAGGQVFVVADGSGIEAGAVLDGGIAVNGGRFVQTGGTVQQFSSACGDDLANPGVYEMQGGVLNGGVWTWYGGRFAHSGGDVACPQVMVDPGSVYELTGTGTLQTDRLLVNYSRGDYAGPEVAAQFIQDGGVCDVAERLSIGGDKPKGLRPEYQLSGGVLRAATIRIGTACVGLLAHSNGQLEVGTMHVDWLGQWEFSGGEATVSEQVLLEDGSTVTAAPGATVHMTGSDFECRSTDPAAMAGLANLRLLFEGAPAQPSDVEVCGQDKGATCDGLADNFALDALQIGGQDAGDVRLVDALDNQPDWVGAEAAYVNWLVIEGGSSLDLNGLNLYYAHASIEPGATIVLNGGNLELIPEPAALALLAAGGLGLLRRRRRT